jgi:hypothetical protein
MIWTNVEQPEQHIRFASVSSCSMDLVEIIILKPHLLIPGPISISILIALGLSFMNMMSKTTRSGYSKTIL